MKNELYHYGIDGQRWGVTHGPPYPLSRSEHRAVVKSQEATEKRNVSYRKSRKFAKRMSDEDLNATIDRLKREETYRQLVNKDKTAKAQKKEIKKQTKAIEKAQKKQEKEQQKSKKQNDGTIKRLIKEAIGSGIKTLGNAGFQELAKLIWPGEKTPGGKFNCNAAGLWSYSATGKESKEDLVNVKKQLGFLNLGINSTGKDSSGSGSSNFKKESYSPLDVSIDKISGYLPSDTSKPGFIPSSAEADSFLNNLKDNDYKTWDIPMYKLNDF